MSEETKQYIKQFARESAEILSYTEQPIYECYVNFKTRERVFKSDSIEYALNQLGIDIKINNTKEQDEFLKEYLEDIRDWFFSGNYYETICKERDL